LAPGESLTLTATDVRRRPDDDPPARPGSVGLDDAVQEAAAVLRSSAAALLADTGDPVLQLTGGMDSRIVLSAIPDERRAGLRAMTLAVPGARDVSVATTVAAQCGLVHQVVSLDGLSSLSSQEWFERVRATAEAHDGMLDPVAKAVTEYAEES